MLDTNSLIVMGDKHTNKREFIFNRIDELLTYGKYEIIVLTPYNYTELSKYEENKNVTLLNNIDDFRFTLEDVALIQEDDLNTINNGGTLGNIFTVLIMFDLQAILSYYRHYSHNNYDQVKALMNQITHKKSKETSVRLIVDTDRAVPESLPKIMKANAGVKVAFKPVPESDYMLFLDGYVKGKVATPRGENDYIYQDGEDLDSFVDGLTNIVVEVEEKEDELNKPKEKKSFFSKLFRKD